MCENFEIYVDFALSFSRILLEFYLKMLFEEMRIKNVRKLQKPIRKTEVLLRFWNLISQAPFRNFLKFYHNLVEMTKNICENSVRYFILRFQENFMESILKFFWRLKFHRMNTRKNFIQFQINFSYFFGNT